jgi:hypothetical protein
MRANAAWIDSFLSTFPGGDVEIISDTWDDAPTNYRWSSPHFNGLTDPAELGARAAALKALYDGAFFIARRGDYAPWPLEQPLEVIQLSSADLELRSPFDPFSPSWSTWRFDSIEDPERDTVSLFLFLSHQSQTARDMLMFLGANGPTWVTLYALKDFMKSGGWKDDRLAAASGVTDKEVERFSRTANNHASLGPFGRHGSSGFLPPKTPMTHPEAVKLILTCADAFLREEAINQNVRAIFSAMIK